ncbi:hypothetical protein, partial [Neobacillus soli]|uniref:hypothetical protein n=1 Tax=Neobacillus soli TaxID=220688 RepID=UPI001C3F2268
EQCFRDKVLSIPPHFQSVNYFFKISLFESATGINITLLNKICQPLKLLTERKTTIFNMSLVQIYYITIIF